MEESEKKLQQMYMEFQMLEQHMKQMQKQLELITQQLVDLTITSNSLDEFKKIKPGNDMFVPLSSGIFAKASLKENSEVLVNVGANIAIKKDVDSAKKLIQSQIEEVKQVQKQMLGELEKMTSRASQLETQLQSVLPQG